jgi:hypothetical protein
MGGITSRTLRICAGGWGGDLSNVMVAKNCLKQLLPLMKNFHLPLPEHIYAQLMAEAERTQVPATALAREAIDLWLRQQSRKARHGAIAAYAEEIAGTSLDLDPNLESAGIEHLVKARKEPK